MQLDRINVSITGELRGTVDLLTLVREHLSDYWAVDLSEGFKEWERPAVFLTEFLTDSIDGLYSELVREDFDDLSIDFSWNQGDYEALLALLPEAGHRPEVKPETRPKQSEMLPIEELLTMAVDVGVKLIETPHPVARATDPGTSWEAAKSVKHVTETHTRIVEILKHGSATDADLYALYLRGRRLFDWPLVSESGLRTRRKELVDMGKVKATGELRRMHTGRRARVWGLVSEK